MKTRKREEGRPSEGRRERKRRETKARIADAALTLFLKRGFAATTVDEVATAADVSKRSFFDYFPAKEDVVFAWQDEFGAALSSAVASRPAGEPPAVVVEEAMTSAIAAALEPRSIAIERLVRDTPALSQRAQVKYARLEHALAEALMSRLRPAPAERFRARLLAMVAIGALRLGSDDLFRDGSPRPAQALTHTKQAFRVLWTELGEMARAGLKHQRQ
jgi:AcrR family transcriptional regulator